MSFFNIKHLPDSGCDRTTSVGISFRRLLSVLAMLLVSIGALYAQLPEEIPDPNLNNPNNFIYDPSGDLSQDSKHHINTVLKDLRDRTSAEVAVAVVPSTGELSIEDYSYRLFKHWGVGKADKDNGVLLVIATNDRRARIEVGSGAEGVIPDISAGHIIVEQIVPAMRAENTSQAASNAVDKIYEAMTDPEVAEELRSNQPEGAMRNVNAVSTDMIWSFLGIVAICVFCFTLVMFLLDCFNARKRSNYHKAMIWGPHLPTYWWGALFSCGLALPIALIAWRLYKYSRNVREVCDTCGAKMNKLSEDEDNAFLSASQDFEEKLGTVDYDVWLCPECGTVERFPYVERQLKYHKCPECSTIAESLVMDKVVEEPTVRREGHGERIYQCQFCRHIRREGYRIPKKPDPAAAALAAGAAAGMFRGGSGGGGGFGGGFGGGSSSGGGASGGW